MASQLSDAELRKKLKELGEDVGPFTATTRHVWVKRLDKLLLEKKQESPRTLNALSSDDSDIDTSHNLDSSRIFRKKKNNLQHSNPVVHLNRLNVGKYLKPQSLDPDKSSFKIPSPVSTRTVGTKGPTRSEANNSFISNFYSSKSNRRGLREHSADLPFDIETSDSEIDSETVLTTTRTPKLKYQNSNHKPTCDKENSFQFRRSRLFSSNDNSFDVSSKKGINTTSQSRKLYKSPTAFSKSERLSFRENSHSKGEFDKSNANGYLTDDAILNGEFQNGKAAGKTTNYSHYISWMLVLGAAAFFIIIGMVYMSEVQKVSQATAISNYRSLTCTADNQTKCIPEKLLTPTLLLCRGLHDLLAVTAGNFECQNEMKGNRNVSISSVRLFLKEQIRELNVDMKPEDGFNLVMLLIVKNPEWNIRMHLKEKKNEHSAETPIELNISALESVAAAKSFWCRVQHSIRWTAAELFVCVLVLAFIILISCAVKYWKQRKEFHEKRMYELVEKIIGILQKPDDICEPGSNSAPPYKAVVHVRDMLIPPKERKRNQWLWDKAVAFIEENESRVRVEYRHIAGESFKIWRWLSNSSPEGEAGRQGKVWQGQAFGSLGKGKCMIPFGATPCLKIRNMFDPEVEYGDDWQVNIQDAILEKCEGNNGIVHIAVDTTANEGCVYLMCNSSDTAGKAFNALHGWWFDGKLVTVKYLRLERYLERFPSAEDCEDPLKPSNNKRLSLAAPFFSSALERS